MLDQILPGIRYLKYASTPLLIIVWSLNNRNPAIKVKPYILPFLFLVLSSFFYFYKFNFLGLKDVFFILSYLTFFILFNVPKVDLEKVNIVLILVFFVISFKRASSGFEFSLGDSMSTLEDTTSFIFGLFFIHSFLGKRYVYCILNLFLMVISLKRIAIVAVVAVLVLYALPFRFRSIIVKPISMVVGNLLLILVIILFSNGYFDFFIINYFGVSPGAFSSGRLYILQKACFVLVKDWPDFLLGGLGAGKAYGFSYEIFDRFQNMHCDVLKILLEHGLLIFILFFYFLYRSVPSKIIYYVFYLNILLLTDNVLIYGSVMFFYLLICADTCRQIEFDELNKVKVA
jgi:hypothetical protein